MNGDQKSLKVFAAAENAVFRRPPRWREIGATILGIWMYSLAGTCADYFVRADGAAINKEATAGCGSAQNAMSVETHNTESFDPGDTVVLCAQGGVFRSTLIPPSSGSSGAPITYLASGGAEVSGSDVVSGWAPVGGAVYVAAVPIEPQQVFVDGDFGDRKDGLEELENPLDWWWGAGSLYLFSSAGDPDGVSGGLLVEAGARESPIYLNGRDSIVLDGLIVRHGNGPGIIVLNGCDFLTIRNCVIEWNYLQGIFKIGGVHHNDALFEGNTIRRNGSVGIHINANHRRNAVRRNIIYENGVYHKPRLPDHQWTAGIKMWGNRLYVSEAVIEENHIFNNGSSGSGSGVWMDSCTGVDGRNIIRRNRIWGNNRWGIFIEKSDNSDVSYNVLHGNAKEQYSAGIGIKASAGVDVGGNNVFNNTITGPHYFALYCGVFDGSGLTRLSNNTFTNNIAVGSTNGILLAENACTNDGIHGTGNSFQFNSLGEEFLAFIWWDWTALSTYSEFDAAAGEPTNSISGDPAFFDEQNMRTWILPTSPGVDSGADLGAGNDSCLREDADWPGGVIVEAQGDQGTAWEIGAYCVTGRFDAGLIFFDGFESGGAGWW